MKPRAIARSRYRAYSRAAFATIAVIVFALVGIQFAHIVKRNMAMARSLRDAQADVQALRARKRAQKRVLLRLRNPGGAVPEIHDRLHLVGPHETIIYLKGSKSPAP
ncbi:MAG: hypothetical protein DLM50_02995 [Candidatus Meridianibacter frigidus]|nr:MAG: hypothetical protein DLM50_02995 [Candidatus Eremiobacteraeota bacterium]